MAEQNNGNLFTGILIIISFLIGMYADKLMNTTGYQAPEQAHAAKPISMDIQKALSHNETLPSVVFSVMRNGSIQAFVPEGSKVIKPKYPLHANNLLNIDTITIFNTSNPKLCWITGAGDQQCVSW